MHPTAGTGQNDDTPGAPLWGSSIVSIAVFMWTLLAQMEIARVVAVEKEVKRAVPVEQVEEVVELLQVSEGSSVLCVRTRLVQLSSSLLWCTASGGTGQNDDTPG